MQLNSLSQEELLGRTLKNKMNIQSKKKENF